LKLAAHLTIKSIANPDHGGGFFHDSVDERNPRGKALKQFRGESKATQSMVFDELYIVAFGSVMIGQRIWSEEFVSLCICREAINRQTPHLVTFNSKDFK
jgi:hypothetical protein